MWLQTSVLAGSAIASDYYVDGSQGDDRRLGTSQESAWKSLENVNATRFSPGDRLLFKAGTSYAGTLRLQGCGREGSPIVVDLYGSGPKPRIDAEGKHSEALLLFNVAFWEVNNLELTNQGETREGGRFGVRVVVDDFGTARHIHLKNLYVHDVNNVLTDEPSRWGGVKVERRGGGIVWMTLNADEAKPSWFDGLLIENCHLLRTDQDGIYGWAGHKDKGKWHPYDRRYWHPNRNVVIRGNLLEDIGGSGIVPRCCAGCLVERNIVRGAASRTTGIGEAGMYVWSCDDTVVQLNEVSGVTGRGPDRMGIDSDFNCRNTVIQYNYSHDNVGGFSSVFTGRFAKGFHQAPWNVGNTGTIIRYNISQNDGQHIRFLFYHVEDGKNVQIYNNTFFVGKSHKLRAFSERLSREYQIRNNLFHVEGELTFDSVRIQDAVFENNALFGHVVHPTMSPNGPAADSGLRAPGTGQDGRESLTGYQLKPGSPCIGAGLLIANNGGQDFWGHVVSATKRPDIGASSTHGSPPPAATAKPCGGDRSVAGVAPEPTLGNVAYGPHPRQVLDLWKAEARQATPVALYIHGGGWMPGSKDKSVVVTHNLTDYLAAGVSVVSINYRLVSQAQAAGVQPPIAWPLHDAARSLQFVRSKADQWGLDKTRIGLFGGSAGACTCLWLAFHDDMAEPQSTDPVARESTRPFCVAVAGAQTSLDPKQMRQWIPNSVYGGHAFGFMGPWRPDAFQRFYDGRAQVLPWIQEYSPIEWVSAGDPPVFLEYPSPPARPGEMEKDPTHSAIFGVELQKRLREVGVQCHLSYPGAPETPYRSRSAFLVDQLKK